MDKWDKDLEDDGADYSCGFVTFLPEMWECPQKGTAALNLADFETARAELPQNGAIQFKHRVFCQTHQIYIDVNVLG